MSNKEQPLVYWSFSKTANWTMTTEVCGRAIEVELSGDSLTAVMPDDVTTKRSWSLNGAQARSMASAIFTQWATERISCKEPLELALDLVAREHELEQILNSSEPYLKAWQESMLTLRKKFMVEEAGGPGTMANGAIAAVNAIADSATDLWKSYCQDHVATK